MTTLIAINFSLIIYGSLYPFEYFHHAASLEDLHSLAFALTGTASMSDAITNIMLFVPTGLLITTFKRTRSRWALVVFSLFLAWALQYIQFWFPSRVPAGSDAWFNTLGLSVGLAMSWQVRHLAESRPGRSTARHPLWPAATLFLLAWVVYRWFPLVPTLDLQNIKNGIKPLLGPFEPDFSRVLHDMAAWLVFFRLARYSLLSHQSPVKYGLLALGITALEPLFMQNQLSHSNILGLSAAICLMPLFVKGRLGLLGLISLEVLSLCVSGLHPFQPGGYRDFKWIPFTGMLEGNILLNMASLLEKAFFYGTTIFLLGYSGMRLLSATLLVSALLFVLEWSQRVLPQRVPEITDVIMALMLGVGIHSFVKRMHAGPAATGPADREPDSERKAAA